LSKKPSRPISQEETAWWSRASRASGLHCLLRVRGENRTWKTGTESLGSNRRERASIDTKRPRRRFTGGWIGHFRLISEGRAASAGALVPGCAPLKRIRLRSHLSVVEGNRIGLGRTAEAAGLDHCEPDRPIDIGKPPHPAGSPPIATAGPNTDGRESLGSHQPRSQETADG
jgi:hypothetical protein